MFHAFQRQRRIRLPKLRISFEAAVATTVSVVLASSQDIEAAATAIALARNIESAGPR